MALSINNTAKGYYNTEQQYTIRCNRKEQAYTVEWTDSTLDSKQAMQRKLYRLPEWTLLDSGASVSTSQRPAATVTYAIATQDKQGVQHKKLFAVATPALPEVAVWLNSLSRNPGCVKEAAFLLRHSAKGEELSYLWDFDDMSRNTSNINPIGKVYRDAGVKYPMLTIIDKYGCFAEGGAFIYANPNMYSGYIDTENIKENVVLRFIPFGSVFPQQYLWYEGSTLIQETDVHYMKAPKNGRYWVLTKDIYGCHYATPEVEVTNIKKKTSRK